MKIKYNFFFTFLAILFVNVLSAQNGKLLLVGGGGEEEGGWSNPPYTWAINNSVNKKVAVISFTTQTTWLPNYFLSLGAVAAKNFTIDASNANLQSTYDSLMNYDVFFIKGGDQYNYYNNYKNTFTQTAIQDKFNAGGVIAGTSAGMAILSNVLFTAENGTVYPEEVLENINNTYMTLNDDFLNLFPGYIFDTHFVERARLSRLIGFLAKWKQDRGEAINGIGVDDRTALAIYFRNGIKKGKVFGTGAVTFVNTNSLDTLSNCSGVLRAKDIKYSQLLNGDSLNFPNTYFQVEYQAHIAPSVNNNNLGNVVLSGDNLFANNQIALQNFTADFSANTRITIITDTVSANVLAFKNYFIQQGFNCQEPLLITSAGINLSNWTTELNSSSAFVFVENDFDTLTNFLYNNSIGQNLRSRINYNTYWVGHNAMYPTSIVFDNYEANYQAYYGNIVIKKGLGILSNFSLFPSSFSNSIDVENGASILPYAMLRDTVQNGFYLNGDVCLKIVSYNWSVFLKYFGTFPAIQLNSSEGLRKFSNTTANATGNPRMVAGFNNMTFSTFCNNDSMLIGFIASTRNHKENDSIDLFPNPAENKIIVELNELNQNIEIFDVTGSLKFATKNTQLKTEVDVSLYSNGIYFVKISNGKNNVSQKFIVAK